MRNLRVEETGVLRSLSSEEEPSVCALPSVGMIERREGPSQLVTEPGVEAHVWPSNAHVGRAIFRRKSEQLAQRINYDGRGTTYA